VKIWKNFKTVSDFKQYSKGLACRSKCALCKKSWNRTRTEFVHYIPPQKPGQKEKYICDECQKSLNPQ
jgi:hypothetical protein